MGKQINRENTYLTGIRSGVMSVRNSLRFNFKARPKIEKQRIGRLATRGLNPTISQDLQGLSSSWVNWAVKKSKSNYSKKIRVNANKIMTGRKNAQPTFVGTGLDENIATRLLKDSSNWKSITNDQAEDVFNARSRTADLIWATKKPIGNLVPGSWEPISGHTPSVKKKLVGGTTAAITVEHGTRDNIRESAIDKTRLDTTSPNLFGDLSVMGTLATIKYMASPSTELETAKQDMSKMPSPRYTALTGKKDIRDSNNFDEMVQHVQEERERKKWEIASVMKGDSRLSSLVPPTMNNYLGTFGNNPLQAMESFRYDTHNSWFAPPVNRSLHSDTEDLTQHSLNTMVTTTQTTQRRARALSDARDLPKIAPPNSRGVV
jgi:hypothetical protein